MILFIIGIVLLIIYFIDNKVSGNYKRSKLYKWRVVAIHYEQDSKEHVSFAIEQKMHGDFIGGWFEKGHWCSSHQEAEKMIDEYIKVDNKPRQKFTRKIIKNQQNGKRK